MSTEYITEIKVYPGNGDKLVARGSFVVADAIAINFTVFKGENGPRVVLPSSPNPKFDSSRPPSKENKKYYDEVRTISQSVREELEKFILEKIDGGNDVVASHNESIPF